MKKIPLLPRYFRWVGLALVLVFVVFSALDCLAENGYYLKENGANENTSGLFFYTFAILGGSSRYFEIIYTDMTLTIHLLSIFLGLSLIAFSRNKVEDEMINSIRLYAWSWAIISFIIFNVLSIAFVYDTSFISFVLLGPNVILLLYIIIFHFQLYKMNRRARYEE